MRYNLFYIQCIHLSLNLIIQGYKENVEIVVLKKRLRTCIYEKKKEKRKKTTKDFHIFLRIQAVCYFGSRFLFVY